jgi:hypothetical protein
VRILQILQISVKTKVAAVFEFAKFAEGNRVKQFQEVGHNNMTHPMPKPAINRQIFFISLLQFF